MSVLWMYLKVFLVGGALCAVGELLVLRTRLTPARILVWAMAQMTEGLFRLP